MFTLAFNFKLLTRLKQCVGNCAYVYILTNDFFSGSIIKTAQTTGYQTGVILEGERFPVYHCWDID